MDSIPGYVSIVFILTTFVSVAFLLQAIKQGGIQTLPSRILIFLLPLWIFFQAILGVGGFYQQTDAMPPRIAVFGVLPTVLLIGASFLFFRKSLIEKLPLPLLTLVHTVRIPVEIVLYWLFIAGAVPQAMTFDGWNFDIVSGLLSPFVFFLAFRGKAVNRRLLIAYNVLGVVLLANIVSIAIMSLPTPLQTMSFDQPNRAVLYFPYIWLPTIVVPIVLFSHLTALWKLLATKTTD